MLMWTVFRAEMKRYFRVQWSNLGDSLSWFLYAFLVFIAAVIILNGISGGEYGRKEQLLVLVGWLTWVVASDCMSELPYIISEEAQTGTLEQVCLAPIPLAGILALRSMAFLLGAGAKGLLAVLLVGIFVAPLPSGPALLLIFAISLVGAYGLGFAFAGLALVFKRTEALVGLVFSLMIFLTGSLVALESLGWVYQVLKVAFPLTWGISLMRGVMSVNYFEISPYGKELGWIALHSLLYITIGLIIFILGNQWARKKGTLSHY